MLIVGGGLAGGLLALALRERGVEVSLIAADQPSATQWSYGVIPGWPLGTSALALKASKASVLWKTLQSRYGDLGWSSSLIAFHAKSWSRLVHLPVSQVDTARFHSRLPEVLRNAGVRFLPTEATLIKRDQDQWLVCCRDGSSERSDQLVLAAGAACRRLWPSWPKILRSSWAGVIELPHWPSSRLELPAQFKRPLVERRSEKLKAPCSVIDVGLVPRGDGALLGQISHFEPCLELADPPLGMEQELWQAVAKSCLPKGLAESAWTWHQVPVAFSITGTPWAGPLQDAPGLFGFSGFTGGFAQAPHLAQDLAKLICKLQ